MRTIISTPIASFDPAAVPTSSAMAPAAPVRPTTRPRRMLATLVLADLAAVSSAMLVAVYGRWWLGGHYDPRLYLQLWPVVGFVLAAFAGAKLYPAVPFSPAEELRRLTIITSLIYLGLAATTFLSHGNTQIWSRSVLLVSWALTLLFVLTARGSLRMMLSRRPWWGRSVVVLGSGELARQVVRTLVNQPEIGLRPVAVIAPGDTREHANFGEMPMLHGLHHARGLARDHGIKYAILAIPDLEARQLEALLQKLSRSFHHLIYVPRMAGFSSLWVTALDMGGTLGLEVRHRLLDPGRRTLKRAMDLALVVLAAPLVLPLLALLALAVKLDSPGPIFYRHDRIGMGGRRFGAWKFRSMVRNSDEALQRALAADPRLREEWEQTQKLRDDPRITRVGRFLRKTSLDELPQLWNVLRGQMSLVGPRPIVDEELPKYGSAYSLYTKVPPGITGLWQISGRNRLSYDERVHLDAYYVRNWSIWLDLYLLSRTVLAVLLCDGAY